MTSASRLHSASMGEPSSIRAARIRAKVLGLGWVVLVMVSVRVMLNVRVGCLFL